MERNVFDYANISEKIWQEFKEGNQFSSIDDEELSIEKVYI